MNDRAAARLAGAVAVLVLTAVGLLIVGLVTGGDGVRTAGDDEIAPLGTEVAVVRVVDGDTLIVDTPDGAERVRHIGINAPELGAADDVRSPECWAIESLAVHEELVAGARLRLDRDRSDRDRFERLLRHAWVRQGGVWVHVGEALVDAGAARARSYPPDTEHDARLGDAEDGARDQRRGLWGACRD